jgi:hypothetical protein
VLRTERKTDDVLDKDEFGFRRGKGMSNATEMLRITLKATVDTDEKLCACFLDWQKEFDHTNCNN